MRRERGEEEREEEREEEEGRDVTVFIAATAFGDTYRTHSAQTNCFQSGKGQIFNDDSNGIKSCIYENKIKK